MSYQQVSGTYEYDHHGRIAIVAGRFNGLIVDSLVRGAVGELNGHGVAEENIDVIYVPGSYELPLAAQKVAERGKHSGIIALGAVIRGATTHFDYVAGECARGLSRVSLDYGLPVMFGVLTTETVEQAVERAGTKAGNKGADAATGLLETLNVLNRIEQL